MITHLYAVCWNEVELLPYFLRHYETFCDKIFIYDNASDDGSRALLDAHPKVVVGDFDNGGQIRDDLLVELKNNAWKDSRGIADWVVIVDIDEFLYHPSVTSLLLRKNTSIVRPHGYVMVSNKMPTGSGQIWGEINEGVPDLMSSKVVLFNPNVVKEINYSPGCHECKPEFFSGYRNIAIERDPSCLLLHCKYIGGEEHLIQRYERNKARLSEINIKNGWCAKYSLDADSLCEMHRSMMKRRMHII